jgi:hypothetical protein
VKRLIDVAIRALVCAVLVAVASEAAAATLYVSPTGNDSNPGTLSAPLATPGRAVELAAAGDTISLREGRYTITRTLLITQPGLTVASYPGERAAIVGGTTDLSGLPALFFVYASSVTIANLELQGGSYYGIKLDDLYGPQTGQRIVGCYIHHTGRDGIKAQRADGAVIEDNEIAFSGVRDGSNAEGIDVIGSLGVTIRRNYIHDIATNGMYLKGGTVGGVVEKNLVVNTGQVGILLGSETDAQFMRNGVAHEAIDSIARNNVVVGTAMAGLGSIAGLNVRFENNTVVDAARTAQGAFRLATNQFGTSPEQVLFKNNVVALEASSVRPLVYTYQFTGTLVSDRNVWFSPNGRYEFWRETSAGTTRWTSLAQWQQAMNVDGTSIAGDPLLNSADLYRPFPESPAIDAGETLAEVVDDYSDIVRPQGAGYDIGAHEGATSAPPPPPPPPAVPSAPTNLTAKAVAPTRIDLAWSDTSATEDGFRIERSKDGQTYTVIATVGANVTAFSDTGVTANTTYYYRVAAFNAGGVSGYSNRVRLKTPRR